jgi:CheY-like chemotaxis protein
VETNDEGDIRTVVRKMLETKGYTVLDAGDPQQALRLATEQPVHLLLTDVVMPLLSLHRQTLHPRCTRGEGPPGVAGAALAVRSPHSPSV